MNVFTRALSAVADWLAAQGRVEEALALAAHVTTLPGTWETARRAAAHCKRLAGALPPEVARAACERGRNADREANIGAVLAPLSSASAAPTAT